MPQENKGKFMDFLDKFKDFFTFEVEHTTTGNLTPIAWGAVGVGLLFAIGFLIKVVSPKRKG
jgi:hypothetical protein